MKIDQDLLAGNYEFQIKVGSTRHMDENTEKADGMLLGKMSESNPLVDKVELTKVLFEKFGFAHLMGRLLRDPQVVSQERQQAQKAQMEAQLAEPKLKTSIDLQKTQIKSDTALKVAQVKGATDSDATNVKSDSDKAGRDSSMMMKLLELANAKEKNGSVK